MIKSEEELARFMDGALRAHANKVLNGQIQPYKGLLEGKTTLNLKMTVVGTDLEFKDADAPPPPPPPIVEEKPIAVDTSDTVEANFATELPKIEETELKPPRKKKATED